MSDITEAMTEKVAAILDRPHTYLSTRDLAREIVETIVADLGPTPDVAEDVARLVAAGESFSARHHLRRNTRMTWTETGVYVDRAAREGVGQ